MNEEIQISELSQGDQYKIHPSVPINILESYYRKKTSQVVGTLLGIVYPNHIEITNCYPVPFLEDDSSNQIVLDKEYHLKMYNHNQKVYQNEIVVGFFMTQNEFDSNVAILNNYYNSKESQFVSTGLLISPILLTIDPKLNNDKFNMKGYTNQQLFAFRDCYINFQEVNLQIEFFNENLNEINPFVNYENNDSQSKFGYKNLDNLKEILQDTIVNLKKMQQYVRNAKEGKINGDIQIGKALKKMLNLAPFYQQESFKQMVSKYMQDTLLIMYLSNLTKSSAVISEKINKL